VAPLLHWRELPHPHPVPTLKKGVMVIPVVMGESLERVMPLVLIAALFHVVSNERPTASPDSPLTAMIRARAESEMYEALEATQATDSAIQASAAGMAEDVAHAVEAHQREVKERTEAVEASVALWKVEQSQRIAQLLEAVEAMREARISGPSYPRALLAT